MSTILIFSQYPRFSRQVMVDSGQSGSGNKGQIDEGCGFQVELRPLANVLDAKSVRQEKNQG